jgi:hypothetical protein
LRVSLALDAQVEFRTGPCPKRTTAWWGMLRQDNAERPAPGMHVGLLRIWILGTRESGGTRADQGVRPPTRVRRPS